MPDELAEPSHPPRCTARTSDLPARQALHAQHLCRPPLGPNQARGGRAGRRPKQPPRVDRRVGQGHEAIRKPRDAMVSRRSAGKTQTACKPGLRWASDDADICDWASRQRGASASSALPPRVGWCHVADGVPTRSHSLLVEEYTPSCLTLQSSLVLSKNKLRTHRRLSQGVREKHVSVTLQCMHDGIFPSSITKLAALEGVYLMCTTTRNS
jgi:hypothetical protein